jgi:hypothetical protein
LHEIKVEAVLKALKLIIPVAALFAGMLINSTAVFAKKEYTSKEKKPCGYCHTNKAPKDDKDLTAAGIHYKEKKSLAGFEEKK